VSPGRQNAPRIGSFASIGWTPMPRARSEVLRFWDSAGEK
jgi:hypothetical protein